MGLGGVTMLVDLVQTTTRDGVRLDGMLQTPATDIAKAWPVDAVCVVHGTGGNFYGSALFDALGEQDGNNIVKGTFRARYDATAAKYCTITLVNELASVP